MADALIDFEFSMGDTDKKYFTTLEKKLTNRRKMLTRAGILMLRSVDKNFQAQGRPRRWKGLAPLTKALRRKGSGGGNFMILQDTGRLRGSMSAIVREDSVAVGTNMAKAKKLHFGGMTDGTELKIKAHKRRITKMFGKPVTRVAFQEVRAHTMKIPPKHLDPRPFVMFQQSDIADIVKLGFVHLEDATK